MCNMGFVTAAVIYAVRYITGWMDIVFGIL